MKNRRQWLSLGCALALLTSALLPAGWARDPVHVTVLQLNDVYDITPVDKGARGGLARVATLVKQVEAQNPHTFLVLGGDTISPSVASRVFKGRQMIDLWNLLGLDAAVLGNHEFDYGNEVLEARMAESQFPWLAANVIDTDTGKPFGGALPYVIKDVEGVQVGFFGLLTPDTAGASHPGPDVKFDDPVMTACRTITAMRAEGADVIIGLTHLAMPEDKALARALTHQRLAAIMGGHEHTLLHSVAAGVPILKVGSDARTLGRLDLYIDPDTQQLLSMDWTLIPVTDQVAEDPAAAARVASYEQLLTAELGQPIGRTDVELNALQADNRSRETNLGNYVADVYRQWTGADVALVNGGSIRSNTTYGPGPLSRRDVLAILPFSNTVVKAEVSGATLRAAIENGLSRLDGEEAGRFPQISGMTLVYDGRRPVGSRLVSATVNGKPLDDRKTYNLATTTYLLHGGDDYVMLKNAKWLSDPEIAPIDAAMVEEAIHQAGHIAPTVDGRHQRLDAK